MPLPPPARAPRRRRGGTRGVLVTAVALAVVAGCTGDDDGGTETIATTAAPTTAAGTSTMAATTAATTTGPTTTTPSPSTSALEGTVVRIEDFAFAPQELEVPAGRVITWVNDDGVDHAVVGAPGGTAGFPNSADVITPGTTYSATFAAPGTYAYICPIHPSMSGTVVVT